MNVIWDKPNERRQIYLHLRCSFLHRCTVTSINTTSCWCIIEIPNCFTGGLFAWISPEFGRYIKVFNVYKQRYEQSGIQTDVVLLLVGTISDVELEVEEQRNKFYVSALVDHVVHWTAIPCQPSPRIELMTQLLNNRRW